MDDVGCPDPAEVVHRMLSTASWAASSFHKCVRSPMLCSVLVGVLDGVLMVDRGKGTAGCGNRVRRRPWGTLDVHGLPFDNLP